MKSDKTDSCLECNEESSEVLSFALNIPTTEVMCHPSETMMVRSLAAKARRKQAKVRICNFFTFAVFFTTSRRGKRNTFANVNKLIPFYSHLSL